MLAISAKQDSSSGRDGTSVLDAWRPLSDNSLILQMGLERAQKKGKKEKEKSHTHTHSLTQEKRWNIIEEASDLFIQACSVK